MAYASSKGRKPFERASKIAHTEIINNPDVVEFLGGCTLPSVPAALTPAARTYELQPADLRGLLAVIAIDGGYTETYVREEFPSASIAFFTCGPLLLKLSDLHDLDARRFIAPEDLAALKRIQRYSLTIPTRSVRLIGEASLVNTVRRTLYRFFTKPSVAGEQPLVHALAWFLFRRWEPAPDDARVELVPRCPNLACTARNLEFRYGDPTDGRCPACGQAVYLTDVFRLHELVDEEQGAGGLPVYLITLIEQIVLVHVIKTIWEMKRTLLPQFVFLKDGPLAFFGQVAPLYHPMRDLTHFLMDQPAVSGAGRKSYLYLAGVEKSGPFVEHAAAIAPRLPAGSFMLPGNDYIYRYIVPGDPATGRYGHNTYYGAKVFYKSSAGEMYVLTVPNRAYTPDPEPDDFPNLQTILHVVGRLRCNMYENALLPIALANKLVSLSEIPSQRILAAFAGGTIQR